MMCHYWVLRCSHDISATYGADRRYRRTMSEEICDFAGAGANVVAKGVSIAQYRDDKSRRRIEAYDAFEENAKKVYNVSFSIAQYAIQYAVIMHDEDRYRKMKKERETRYCFAGYDKEVGGIETYLDNLEKPHLRTWYEARSAADTLIACRRFLSRKKNRSTRLGMSWILQKGHIGSFARW